MNSTTSDNNTDVLLGEFIIIEQNTTCHIIRAPSTLEQLLFGIGLPVFDILSVAFNITSFFIYTLHPKQLQAPTYPYLAALSFVYTTSLLAQIGQLMSITFFYNYDEFGFLLATLFWPVMCFSTNCSTCLYAAVAIERYYYVIELRTRSAVFFEKQRTKSWRNILILVLFVLLCNLPFMANFQYDQLRKCFHSRWDTATGSWFSVYTILRMALFNIVMIFLSVTYQSLLVRAIRKKQQAKNSLITIPGSFNKSNRNTEHQLSLTLIVSMLICVFIELLSVVFSPISVTLFWAKYEILSYPARTAFLKIIMPMRALEYTMITLCSLIINETFRKIFIATISCSSNSE